MFCTYLYLVFLCIFIFWLGFIQHCSYCVSSSLVWILTLSLDGGVNVHYSHFIHWSTVSLGVLCVAIHCQIPPPPVELCSFIRSHLCSLMFGCHVHLCYMSLELDICCFLYAGSFPWCLTVVIPYCIYLLGFHYVGSYGLCWGGGQVV